MKLNKTFLLDDAKKPDQLMALKKFDLMNVGMNSFRWNKQNTT